MLAGEAPFRSKTLAQIIAKKLSTNSLDLSQEFPHISRGSVDLVRLMTERDPARRVANYAELIARIDELKLADATVDTLPRRSSAFATTQLIRSDPTPERAAIPTLGLRPPQPRRLGLRRSLIALGGGMLAVIVGIGAWTLWPSHGQAPPLLVPTGLGVNLFDGLSLSGWRTQSGIWSVRRNEEKGRVLSGTSGRTLHSMVKQVKKERVGLVHFSLSVVIQLHGASAAEIEFGGDPLAFDMASDRPRLVARLNQVRSLGGATAIRARLSARPT